MSRIVPNALVAAVRLRAHDACEYCKTPYGLLFYGFQIDHVIARRYKGASSIDNLAWACASCNLKKSVCLSGIDPFTSKITVIFNPRVDDWKRHFKLVDGSIKAKTAKARATLELLEMNSEWAVAVRQEYYEARPVF